MNVTPEQIVAVAKKHVTRYERRVEEGLKGNKGVRLGECEAYLDLWRSIVAKAGTNLSPTERCEARDAYFCGEFDDK